MNDKKCKPVVAAPPPEQLKMSPPATKEKDKKAAELALANKELAFQNEEKDKRAAELIVANRELAFQSEEKDKRAAELVIANKELAFQNTEKDKRAAELAIANKELAFQNEEKGKRAAELAIANKELAFQNEEKEKRAAELAIANKELAFQNEEKDKRAAELAIENKELAFQNGEKDKRAAELVIANKELAFQNEEKEKRSAELAIADKELAFQSEEKGKRATERKELETYNDDLQRMVKEKVKEISESQMATIFALAKLAEARDEDTGNHLKRVQIFCRLLAEKLSLRPDYKGRINAEFIDTLQKASPLHDIGKVGIRDAILLKPGKLTPEEFEEMKQHTVIGAATLEEVYQNYPGNYFIKIGIEIARSHHEKWDGSGYPDGLRGNEIPLSAQIMALVDVYDALRSKRVYKKAYSKGETRATIIEGANKHFNPLLVETFLKFEKEFENAYV